MKNVDSAKYPKPTTRGGITQGQGSYAMELSHYEMVPANVQQQIVSKSKVAGEEEEE